jgi:hypothetical protein
MKNLEQLKIGPKTIEEWNSEWANIPAWMSPDTYELQGEVGVIRFLEDGKVVAYSLGTELVAGLRKRLADFFRDSESGRNYATGRRIYTQRHRLTVQVLVAGSDAAAPRDARQLKSEMMRLHPPAWFHKAPVKSKRRKARSTRAKQAAKPVSAAQVKATPYTGTIPKG